MEIRQLRQKVDLLQRAGSGQNQLGRLENILRGLSPDQQATILHGIRGGFGKALHPDRNPTVDPENLKVANTILDNLRDELKRRI